jgi:hypothetical protein
MGGRHSRAGRPLAVPPRSKPRLPRDSAFARGQMCPRVLTEMIPTSRRRRRQGLTLFRRRTATQGVTCPVGNLYSFSTACTASSACSRRRSPGDLSVERPTVPSIAPRCVVGEQPSRRCRRAVEVTSCPTRHKGLTRTRRVLCPETENPPERGFRWRRPDSNRGPHHYERDRESPQVAPSRSESHGSAGSARPRWRPKTSNGEPVDPA